MPKKQYVQKFQIVFPAEVIEPIIQESIQDYLDDEIGHFPEWVLDFLLYENKTASVQIPNQLDDFQMGMIKNLIPKMFKIRLEVTRKT